MVMPVKYNVPVARVFSELQYFIPISEDSISHCKLTTYRYCQSLMNNTATDSQSDCNVHCRVEVHAYFKMPIQMP